jgi:hypothetical protein
MRTLRHLEDILSQGLLTLSQLTIQLSPLKALNQPGVDGLERGLHALFACRQEEGTMAKFLCVLLVIGAAARMGYLREMASEYVSPSEAVPRGKIPRCKFNC